MKLTMERYWFLTSTFYGNWLPGDERGSVTRVREGLGPRREHDRIDEEIVGAMPGLEASARSLMKGPIVRIDAEQAKTLFTQFQETTTYLGWFFVGVAIVANHVHWLVGVNGDPDPEKILGSLKSYGSRALNRRWPKPPNGTWWTESGSKRKLKSWAAIAARVEYLREQPFPLLIWIHPDFETASGGRQPSEGKSPVSG